MGDPSVETKTECSKTASVDLGSEFGANPLHEWFANHKGNLINKWHHYFDIYHRHFGAIRAAASPQRKIIMYEIGLWNGGSLEMWLDYFGRDRCEIYGFDIDLKCKALEKIDPHIHVTIGDQGDVEFLQKIVRTLPQPDIVLDDGGHFMEPQIRTMQILFKHLKPNGIFMCEDTHTSYMWMYGGKVNRRTTYIEATKKLVDSMHSFYSDDIAKDYYSAWCNSVHMYDSVVVLEKRPKLKSKPTSEIRGKIELATVKESDQICKPLHNFICVEKIGVDETKHEAVVTLNVQIVRATYGDSYARKDVRDSTYRALKQSFLKKGAFDLTDIENAPNKLYGDPCPGRLKLLQLEIRCVVNEQYATTQLFSVCEENNNWVAKDRENLQVPHKHTRLQMNGDTVIKVDDYSEVISPLDFRATLASPPTTSNAVHNSSWDVLKNPLSIDAVDAKETKLEKKAPKPAPQTEAKINIVCHICTIGNWKEIVEDQFNKIRDSGLYDACCVIYISIVGDHALDWQPHPDVRQKVQVLHRATDPTRYERSAIDILQSEPDDDPRSCWLYLHTKGVRHGKSNFNVQQWRNCLEYYTIEKFIDCVRVLLSGYDTCGPFWQNSHGINLPGQHYSGNFWWATGSYLVKLRAYHTTSTYISPEMWIGYAQPRAWSTHNVSKEFDLYNMAYPRKEYEGKIKLPLDAISPNSINLNSVKASLQTAPSLPSSTRIQHEAVPLRRLIESQVEDKRRQLRFVEGVVRALPKPLLEGYTDSTNAKLEKSGVSVCSSTYGDSIKRIDITDRVRNANGGFDAGLALAFSNSMNIHKRLISDLPDLSPGVPKYLDVNVEYDVAGSKESVESAYGIDVVVNNNNCTDGLPPMNPGLVRLKHTITIDEYNNKWRTPKTIVPRATMSLIVLHGLANQIYSIASGCLIAYYTRRALTFPFRVVARQSATDIDNPYVLPKSNIDREFEHLFNVQKFTERPVCMLYKPNPNDAQGSEKTDADEKSNNLTSLLPEINVPEEKSNVMQKLTPKRELEAQSRFERALLHGDTKLEVPPEWTRSSDLDSVYALSNQHVLAFNPFFAVVPTNNEDYNRMVDVILSLRPAMRLQNVADVLQEFVRSHSLKCSERKDYVVVHCRQEADWPKELAAVPDTFATNTRKHLRDAGYSGTVLVYVMGGSLYNDYWTQILLNEKNATDVAGVRIVWACKEMWFDRCPELSDLKFEESALVDREIALSAAYFIPFNFSTLSSLVVVEREAIGRTSAPIMLHYEAYWLLDKSGNTLYSYNGKRRRSSMSGVTSPLATVVQNTTDRASNAPSSAKIDSHLSIQPSRLQIVAITFGGASVSTGDFCVRLAAFLRPNSMYVNTDVDLIAHLGDPLPGKPKALVVDYIWNGVPLRRVANERNCRLREPLVIGDIDELCKELPRLKLASNIDIAVLTAFPLLWAVKKDTDTKSMLGADGRGLEIGGPSDGFDANFYPMCTQLDNIVFSPHTVWHSTASSELAPPSSSSPLQSSPYTIAKREVGRQYIGEASDTKLPSASYDYILASHCLEHASNTLKTLREWQRLVKPGGWIVLVLPWRFATFDHRRPYTTIEHAREDFANDVDVRERSLKNIDNRCLNQHVFSQRLLFEIATELGYRVLEMDVIRQYDMICIYQMPPAIKII